MKEQFTFVSVPFIRSHVDYIHIVKKLNEMPSFQSVLTVQSLAHCQLCPSQVKVIWEQLHRQKIFLLVVLLL